MSSVGLSCVLERLAHKQNNQQETQYYEKTTTEETVQQLDS